MNKSTKFTKYEALFVHGSDSKIAENKGNKLMCTINKVQISAFAPIQTFPITLFVLLRDRL